MENQTQAAQQKPVLTAFTGNLTQWLKDNQAQVDAWKSEHSQGIFALTQGKAIALFKNPTRHEMNYALSKAEKDATLDMFEALANSTFLGGDEGMLKTDRRFFGIVQKFKEVMEGEKTELVNL